MVGIPVLLNLLYVIPFLLIPLVNMAIAALALCLKLMPAAVYPVPDGLLAFSMLLLEPEEV